MSADIQTQTVTQKTTTIAQIITLQMAIETFIEIDMMGKSSKTKAWYRDRLKLFAQKIGGPAREISSILEVDLLDWYRNLEDSKLAPDTQHGYVRVVRKLFKFLHYRNIMLVDISQDLKLPRLPKRARKGISDKNVCAILEAAKDNSRDFALVHFLESTSARRGGIANLTMEDIAIDQPEPLCRRATVHEKGDKDRTVIMSHEALNALTLYLSTRKVESEFVFATSQGKRLTPEGVSEVLDRYKSSLGLQGSCSPHQWRHRWCRKRIQDKMPLSQVSQLAGHQSVVVTADFYGTFAVDELQEAFDRYYLPPK